VRKNTNSLFSTTLPVSAGALLCMLGMTIGTSTPSALGESVNLVSLRMAGQAQAQAQDSVSAKVVKADGSMLRCGDQDVFYAITELNAGTVLQAVGTSGSYTKVLMPTTIGGFVPANEVDATPDAGVVVLAVASKLRAPSHLLGLSGSWKALYTDMLPAGTSLKVIETLLSDAGDILGYRVSTPTGPTGELAVGYIKTDALRDASADEAENSDAPRAPTQAPVEEPAVEQVDEAKAKAVKEVDTSLLEEMNLPTDEPIEIVNTTPKAQEQPVATEPTTRTAPSGRVSASALEDLEAAFDSARELSRAELDATLDELRAEFARTREQADDGTSLATALDQRLEWIAIRIESRNQRQAITAVLAAYDANADQVAGDIAAWQSGRAYQLVGRMVTSAIYTGEHLPLLYRVQATDPSTGATRTIGYVAPAANQDFRHLLGRVVGVVGSMNEDSSLHLNVIEPERIDPMPE